MLPFDPRISDEHGIVYVGGELNEENILQAYSKGIFPWPHGNLPLLWFSPPERGMLFLEDFKIPHSAKKELKKKNFSVTIDEDFEQVIQNCAAQKRDEQGGTWITPKMQKAYMDLHHKGIAHSLECWNGGRLVGGLYGVCVKNVFSGESMFFKESAASKACLIALVEHLRKLGHTWFDIQMVTPVLELFGGEYVDREIYLELLENAQKNNSPWRV